MAAEVGSKVGVIGFPTAMAVGLEVAARLANQFMKFLAYKDR